MKDNSHSYEVTKMCEAMNVSRSGYYKHKKSGKSTREQENEKLKKEIQFIFKTNRRSYGARRITNELKEYGYPVNIKRVRRLMRELDIKVAKRRKKYKQVNKEKVEVNILDQDFTAESPNQKWVSDITETRTNTGKAYICAIMDLYSRYIIGYTVKSHYDAKIVVRAFKRAEMLREVKKGMIFHSDKGTQYTSSEVKGLLKKRGIIQSMSGTGNCFDNAAMESFFSTLKKEFIHKYTFNNIKELREGIDNYIYNYNNYRAHSTLGYLSPREYEKRKRGA